jgi:hypothetical protein
VPSLKQRTGDFSELCPEGFSAGFCNDPVHQLFNVFANAPYPNNQVPQAQINSVSKNLLSFFPLPNVGTNLFSATQTLSNNTDQFGIKIDHYLTPRDTLNFNYMFNQLSQVDPLSPGGASLPGFPVGENQRAQNFVAQETHTFSPSLIGVARFSFLAQQVPLRRARKPSVALKPWLSIHSKSRYRLWAAIHPSEWLYHGW